MDMKRCLYCLDELSDPTSDYHAPCSFSFFGSEEPPKLEYSFSEMEALAKTVVSNHIAVTGVQPKLSLSLIDETLKKTRQKRLTVVGALGGDYILKPPSSQYPELPANEHLTMKMAELFGIQTVKCSLIRLRSGELAYITRRIDRKADGSKTHMLDMFQITNAVDKYKGSVERIGKALFTYSSDTLMDQLRFFEVILFCFLTGNNDMHLKNFSMILTEGKWDLSPAYDLLNVTLANPADTEEMALTIEGKKRGITRKTMNLLAKNLYLNAKQISSVYERFKARRSDAETLLNHSFLSEECKHNYLAIMSARYAVLGLDV